MRIQHVAVAAFFLSAKVEEFQRSLRTVVSAALHLKRKRDPVDRQGMVKRIEDTDRDYPELRDRVLRAEEALLRVLGFELTVRLPYPAVVRGVEAMWTSQFAAERGLSEAEDVAKAAWLFVNDT